MASVCYNDFNKHYGSENRSNYISLIYEMQIDFLSGAINQERISKFIQEISCFNSDVQIVHSNLILASVLLSKKEYFEEAIECVHNAEGALRYVGVNNESYISLKAHLALLKMLVGDLSSTTYLLMMQHLSSALKEGFKGWRFLPLCIEALIKTPCDIVRSNMYEVVPFANVLFALNIRQDLAGQYQTLKDVYPEMEKIVLEHKNLTDGTLGDVNYDHYKYVSNHTAQQAF